MKTFFKYLKYILEHKLNVFIEGRKLSLGIWQLLIHDISKFSRYEFNQYKNKFFGVKFCGECENSVTDKFGEGYCNVRFRNLEVFDATTCPYYKRMKTAKVDVDFNLAWLHHQHKNKHHWQYWLQVKKHKIVAYEMPKKYALEMIADWNAMSRKFKQNTYDWYSKQSDIILHETTRIFVEDKLK